MAMRNTPFVEGEWYHCYTRTVDKSRPFEVSEYVERFLETLFLANNIDSIPNIPNLHRQYLHEEIFALPRKQPLVAIGCYSIMPTHYHFLLQPLIEGGLSQFMHKVGTGFTKFYNEHNGRVGNLFVKPFRSKHISTDAYLHRVVPYIHLNPVELFEPGWKTGVVREPRVLPQRLRGYEYSSLWEHEGIERPQSAIVHLAALQKVRDNAVDAVKMLDDAADYYQFLDLDL